MARRESRWTLPDVCRLPPINRYYHPEVPSTGRCFKSLEARVCVGKVWKPNWPRSIRIDGLRGRAGVGQRYRLFGSHAPPALSALLPVTWCTLRPYATARPGYIETPRAHPSPGPAQVSRPPTNQKQPHVAVDKSVSSKQPRTTYGCPLFHGY